MKYEGNDVNRMIANGLMAAGGMIDRNKSEAAPAPTVAPRSIASQEAKPSLLKDGANSTPSVISHRMKLTGSVETQDELHIYGVIAGNVNASSLVVFKGGVVKGEVVAEAVTVHGEIEGSIQGKKVHLASTANVRGDIFHEVIGIDPGAQFEGASKRIAAPVAVANDASEAA
jgi:cytoskeletal protein CcmA (bactofilin family)